MTIKYGTKILVTVRLIYFKVQFGRNHLKPAASLHKPKRLTTKNGIDPQVTCCKSAFLYSGKVKIARVKAGSDDPGRKREDRDNLGRGYGDLVQSHQDKQEGCKHENNTRLLLQSTCLRFRDIPRLQRAK